MPRLGLPIFLVFLGLYLFLGSREKTWADATPMWEVAESLVVRHEVNVKTRWNTPRGPDGKIYAVVPLITSLVHVPGAYLRHHVEKKFPGTWKVTWPLACHLGPAVLGALTCALFFALARRFAGLRAAALATAAVGLATGVAYYARSPYSEILQTFCFTGLALAVLDALEDASARNGRRVGIWLGLLVNSKLVFAVVIPGLALVFAWRHRRELRRLLIAAAWAAGMLALAAIPILAYNWVRWGDPLDSGYGPAGRGTLWSGAWGLLSSPGKSVFLYSPPLLLALAGMPAFYRRNRAFALALLAAFVPVFLVYARFMHWDGDFAWGPRYLTFALPAACVPLAIFLERAMAARRRWLNAVVVAAGLTAGLTVQVVGSAYYWGYWIRMSLAASDNWLGKPSCGPPRAREVCWPGDKILSWMHWLPDLQPIAGHLWMLRHLPFHHPFAVAEDDAPWQHDGEVRIPAAQQWYDAVVGIDWWYRGWGDYPRAARALAAVMILTFGAGVLLWWRRVVAARRRLTARPRSAG